MASRAVSTPLAQLPNALTVLRLAAIPLFVAFMLAAEGGHSWAAGIVFGAAGVTDQLDGFLARRWRVESAFGRVADPLADRLMIDAAVILLWLDDRLPWAALALILARDAVLLAGYKLLAPRGYDLNVSLLGKLATWILYASLAFTIVTQDGAEWPLWLFWTGLALALVAGAGYAVTALRTVRKAA
ncbi:MAG: CDP-alcohol phosphatidyltransferase family protein [Gaiellaceae bacterium]